MKKLVRGVVQFRETRRKDYRKEFAWLALGQKPDALFIACSDSRVQPNIFASTDPGDLFVIRNVGNLIPPAEQGQGEELGMPIQSSEAAGIQFAVENLKVRDIIVCGHSSCGAMASLIKERDSGRCGCSRVSQWLENAKPLLGRPRPQALAHAEAHLPEVDVLSQSNVLLQLEHLMTYPVVRARVEEGTLRLHAWWFDLGGADVYVHVPEEKRFALLDEERARSLLGEPVQFA